MENNTLNEFKEFPVVIYSELEKFSDVLSKARCRIFYKYLNRNGSYITDEFAEQLISSVPYTPVKGIYNEFTEDYQGHGKERTEGRIYGIVPENPNFAWEKFLDEDGIEREYACVDVYLFTAIYEEAKEIVGKPQSMELYAPSIDGEWMTIEGQKAFVFKKGCFLGLQVLGDDVEPCFEGAAFFSLYNEFQKIINEIKQYENSNSLNNNAGGKIMPNANFRLSDDEKYTQIFDLLNPDFNEESEWKLNYIVEEVCDNYAVVYNCEDRCHERAYYTNDEEANTIALNECKKAFIVDVTKNELNALKNVCELNGGTYEKAEEVYSKVEELNTQISELEQKNEEFSKANATLITEKEELNEKFSALSEQFEALTNECNELKEYKLQKENAEKEAIINKYSVKVEEEILNRYREHIVDYTLEQLDKELAFELVNSNPSIFSLEEPEQILIPKAEPSKSGLEALLEGYKNR